MQATLTPSSVELLPNVPADQIAQISEAVAPFVRNGLLKDHWELKILFWGLGVIALAYTATYLAAISGALLSLTL